MACMLTTFAMKTRTRIACWNLRTLLESSRLNQAADQAMQVEMVGTHTLKATN
jgi:hypothetical protein